MCAVHLDLWLDDERDPQDHGCAGWRWVRTAEELIEILAGCDLATVRLSLDHDLGDAQLTGYDVLVWIEREVAAGRSPPMSIALHSQNPVGRQRMQAALASIHRLARPAR